MPYITQQRREFVDDFVDALIRALGGETVHEGDVNYVITRILLGTILAGHPRYCDFNASVGVLECAKLELYRRFAVPYEDVKIEENGDVT